MPKRIIQILINGVRHTIRFGRVPDPEAFRANVVRLANTVKYDHPISFRTAQWLSNLSDAEHDKLARAGLVGRRTERRQTHIGTYFAAYIKSRTDLKQSTIDNFNQSMKSITDFFGELRDMADITRGDAHDWRRQIGKAPATVAMYVKKARQVYQDAIDRKLIAENPFRAIKAGSMANAERQVYVTTAAVEKVIDACPDNEWKMIFAAARYQGMRVPSETQLLTWDDIFWGENRMRVRSPKTAHHAGKETRIVPIFPEFMRFLLLAFSDADRDAKYVFKKLRGENLRTTALKIIERAGPVWVKPFQNLRSSCETDLTSRFPLHVACAWIGNSAGVALKHYLQVTEAHFEQASQSADKSAAEVPGNERKSNLANAQKPLKNQSESAFQMPPVGAESVAVSRDLLQGAHQALQSALNSLNLNAKRKELINGLAKAVHRVSSPARGEATRG